MFRHLIKSVNTLAQRSHQQPAQLRHFSKPAIHLSKPSAPKKPDIQNEDTIRYKLDTPPKDNKSPQKTDSIKWKWDKERQMYYKGPSLDELYKPDASKPDIDTEDSTGYKPGQ